MSGSSWHRGGIPEHMNKATIAGTLEEWELKGKTTEILFHNSHATESIELFLAKDASDEGAGAGLIVVARTGVTIPAEVHRFWTLSTNASEFQAVLMHRGRAGG